MRKKLIALAVATMAIATFAGCGKTVNLNKYVSVEVNGYDGYGEVEVVWNEDALKKDFKDLEFTNGNMRMLFGSPAEYITDYCVDYELSAEDDLKNGDKVTLKWDVDEAAVSEATKAKVKYSDITVTVKGLDEVQTFDAFTSVELQYSGVAPNGRVSVVNIAPSDSDAAKLTYTVSPNSGLKNGDTVTVTVNRADNAEYMISYFNGVPEKATKEYTVKGLDSYATCIADISEEFYNKMDKQARDEFMAHMADYYDDFNDLKNLELVGNYFLTPKNPDAYGVAQNYIDFVYKVTAHDYSTGGTFDYYWYCGFQDVLVLADGTVTMDLTNNTIPNGSYSSWSRELSGEAFWHGGDYYYIGHDSLDSLFYHEVGKWVADYNYENTVK